MAWRALPQAAQQLVDALCSPARAPAAAVAGGGATGGPATVAAAAAEAGAVAAATAEAARDLLLLLAYLGHLHTAGGWAPVEAHWAALVQDVAPKVGRGSKGYG